MITSMPALKRQFINDERGNCCAVILPFEEYVIVKDLLNQTQMLKNLDSWNTLSTISGLWLIYRVLCQTFAMLMLKWWEHNASCINGIFFWPHLTYSRLQETLYTVRMTALLQEVVDKVQELPETSQNALATWLLDQTVH